MCVCDSLVVAAPSLPSPQGPDDSTGGQHTKDGAGAVVDDSDDGSVDDSDGEGDDPDTVTPSRSSPASSMSVPLVAGIAVAVTALVVGGVLVLLLHRRRSVAATAVAVAGATAHVAATVASTTRGHRARRAAAERGWIADGGVSVNVDDVVVERTVPPTRGDSQSDAPSTERSHTPSRPRPQLRRAGSTRGVAASKRRSVKNRKRRGTIAGATSL
jgi:hypothetical protein